MIFIKQLLFLAIFAGSGTGLLVAQSPDRTYQDRYNGIFLTEVFCDGVQVDLVQGVLSAHSLEHFDKEGISWVIVTGMGTATGLWSGETFTYREVGGFKAFEGTYTWRYHLIGDQGSHYIGTVTWNYITNQIFPGRTICLHM